MKNLNYTRKQELANSLTHGLGILLILAGIPLGLNSIGSESLSTRAWLSLAIYVLSLLMVYINSTFYHALVNKTAKKVFKILDHISIYFLIAGTTTYFVLKYVPGTTGLVFIIFQWLLVLAGTIFKIFFTGRFKLLSTFLYLALGLMVLVVSQSLWTYMPASVTAWVLAGGALYTGGIVFYLWKKLYYQHAIWHLFVLAGSVSHYIALLNSFQTA